MTLYGGSTWEEQMSFVAESECGGEGDKLDKSISEAAPGLVFYCLSADDSSGLGDINLRRFSNNTSSPSQQATSIKRLCGSEPTLNLHLQDYPFCENLLAHLWILYFPHASHYEKQSAPQSLGIPVMFM